MTRLRLMGRMAIVVAAVELAGCDSGGSSSEPIVTGTAEISPIVVGTVSLSATHTISFLDYGDGQGGVQETLNVDRDVDAPVKLVGRNLEGHTLGDVYRLFAGAQMDPSLLGRLEAIDVRGAERMRTASVSPETQRIIDSDVSLATPPMVSEVAPRLTASLPTTRGELSGGLETRTSAGTCTEPPWDWTADAGWFYQNYCGPTSKACFTQVTSAWTGWHGGGWFSATGFAQSFCSTANWNVQRKDYGGFPSYGIAQSTLVNVTLQPRTLQTNAWTNIGSSHYYYGQVTSTSGFAVGLAFNGS